MRRGFFSDLQNDVFLHLPIHCRIWALEGVPDPGKYLKIPENPVFLTVF
jgi:hypothetical protein